MAPSVRASARGFSLIELVIVVVILALIGAIAVPRLSQGAGGGQVRSYAAELRSVLPVIAAHRAETGEWPSDSGTGLPPSELAGELPRGLFGRPTPLGGRWDFEHSDNGITAAFGTHFSGPPPLARLAEVDELIDDGNLSTGSFRRLTDPARFYFVLEP